MKRVVYLNFDLDNSSDLELYTLLESFGRSKKSIIKIALIQSGMLSGSTCPPVRVPKLSTQKKVPVKKKEPVYNDSKYQPTVSTEEVRTQESVTNGPSVEERPIIETQQPVHVPEPSMQKAESFDMQSDFPQIGKRYFTREQIEVIKQLSNVNISLFENEGFCQVMAEELGTSTDRNQIRDAYTEASWS